MGQLTVRLGSIDGLLVAEVRELPGCVASGETIDELLETLRAVIRICLRRESGGGEGSFDLPLPIVGAMMAGDRCEISLDPREDAEGFTSLSADPRPPDFGPST